MGKTSWDKYYENLKKDSKTKVELEKTGRVIDIAIQIYDLRRRRRLTQKELANMIGVKQSNIARLENIDYRGYSLQTLEKIASALGANLNVSFISNEKEKREEVKRFDISNPNRGFTILIDSPSNTKTNEKSLEMSTGVTIKRKSLPKEYHEQRFLWSVI